MRKTDLTCLSTIPQVFSIIALLFLCDEFLKEYSFQSMKYFVVVVFYAINKTAKYLFYTYFYAFSRLCKINAGFIALCMGQNN